MKNLATSLPKPKVLNEICSIHTDTKLIKGTIPGHAEPICPKCVAEQIKNKDQLAFEHLESRKTYQRLFNDSVITDPDIREMSFDNFNVTNAKQNENFLKAKQIANRYLNKDYKGNAILVGKAGTGKTHLAYSLLKYVNENSEQKQACLFIDFNELLSKIKSNFKTPSTMWQEGTMLDNIGEADLVVLDDLGSEASFKAMNNESSEWNQRFLFNILNRRNRTIITTNLSGAELKEVYNPKIVSRINKGIKNNVVVFTDDMKDQRKDLY
ncbi:ATP-binding protein [Fructilactobacillus vespulae]|uniref:ATP-binding protein n=1 Tax=Fructilactobacillus vespulae TaxID=1249630 RepID=UPI0039B37277